MPGIVIPQNKETCGDATIATVVDNNNMPNNGHAPEGDGNQTVDLHVDVDNHVNGSITGNTSSTYSSPDSSSPSTPVITDVLTGTHIHNRDNANLALNSHTKTVPDVSREGQLYSGGDDQSQQNTHFEGMNENQNYVDSEIHLGKEYAETETTGTNSSGESSMITDNGLDYMGMEAQSGVMEGDHGQTVSSLGYGSMGTLSSFSENTLADSKSEHTPTVTVNTETNNNGSCVTVYKTRIEEPVESTTVYCSPHASIHRSSTRRLTRSTSGPPVDNNIQAAVHYRSISANPRNFSWTQKEQPCLHCRYYVRPIKEDSTHNGEHGRQVLFEPVAAAKRRVSISELTMSVEDGRVKDIRINEGSHRIKSRLNGTSPVKSVASVQIPGLHSSPTSLGHIENQEYLEIVGARVSRDQLRRHSYHNVDSVGAGSPLVTRQQRLRKCVSEADEMATFPVKSTPKQHSSTPDSNGSQMRRLSRVKSLSEELMESELGDYSSRSSQNLSGNFSDLADVSPVKPEIYMRDDKLSSSESLSPTSIKAMSGANWSGVQSPFPSVSVSRSYWWDPDGEVLPPSTGYAHNANYRTSDRGNPYFLLGSLLKYSSEYNPTTEGVMQHSPWPNVMQWGKVKVNDRQHMVEEVKMMQHALQKYKLELRALELRAHSSHSKVQLSKTERDELDGLQMLRQEVLKEVAELEHLLALRMRGIIAGVEQSSTGLTQRNDLAGLNVVHLMIELMKEQVYHGNIVNGMETERALSPVLAELQLSQEDHDTSMAQTGKTQIVDHLSLLQKQLTAQQNHTTTQLQNTLKEIRSTLLEEIRSSIQVETQQIRFQMQSAEEQLEVLKHRVNSVSREQSLDLDGAECSQDRVLKDFPDTEPDKSPGTQQGTVVQ